MWLRWCVSRRSLTDAKRPKLSAASACSTCCRLKKKKKYPNAYLQTVTFLAMWQCIEIVLLLSKNVLYRNWIETCSKWRCFVFTYEEHKRLICAGLHFLIISLFFCGRTFCERKLYFNCQVLCCSVLQLWIKWVFKKKSWNCTFFFFALLHS